jgi:hypothetical protein
LLPEFLWIDSLVQEYGEPAAAGVFNDFLAAADPFNGHPKEILDGTIGAFRFIPEQRLGEFMKALEARIDTAVARPLGYLFSFYPNCPMAWMTSAQIQLATSQSTPTGISI